MQKAPHGDIHGTGYDDDDYLQGEEGGSHGALKPGDERDYPEDDEQWEGDEGVGRPYNSQSKILKHRNRGYDDDDEDEFEDGKDNDADDDASSMTLEEYMKLQQQKKAGSSVLQRAANSLPAPRAPGEGERHTVEFGAKGKKAVIDDSKAHFKAEVAYSPPMRTETMTWIRLPVDLPHARTSMVAFAFPREKPTDEFKRVWIYGGMNSSDVILGDGLVLDLQKLKVSGRNFAGAAVPARSSAAGGLYGSWFYLVGGYGTKGRDGSLYVLTLNIANDTHSHWGVPHQPLVIPEPDAHNPVGGNIPWCGCPVKDLTYNKSNLNQTAFTYAIEFHAALVTYLADSAHSAHYHVANPLEPLSHHTAVLVGSEMFVFGGRKGKTIVNNLHMLLFSTSQTTLRHTLRDSHYRERYLLAKPDTYTWQKNVQAHGKVPPPRMAHAACFVMPFQMWVIGGYDGTSELNDIWVFDTKTKTWTEKKLLGSLPPLSYHSATYVNKYIFIFGGYSHGQFSNSLFIIDPASNKLMQFDISGEVPSARGGHAAVVLNNRLLIIGGHNHTGALADMFFLDNIDNFTLHESTLGFELVKQFNTPAFADVLFDWEETTSGKPHHIFAHKCILAVRSPAFMKLFTSDTPLKRKPMPAAAGSPQQRTVDVISMPKSTSVDVFVKFLEFLYSDTIRLSSANAAEILALARQYDVGQLEKICQSVQDRVLIPPSSFLSDMRLLMRNPLFSDVQFVVQDKPIPAHRVVVGARCEYFRNMLVGQFREAQEQRVRLDEIEYELFDAILTYLYTDVLDTSNVQMLFDMLCQSDLFGLDYLKTRCEKLLSSEMLTGATAVLLYQAGVMFHSPELATKAFQYILHEVNASYGYNDELMEALTPEILERINEIRTAQGKSKFEVSAAIAAHSVKLINWRNNCPHCQLPYMYDPKTWTSQKTPKELLAEWYTQHHRFKEARFESITTRTQIGHHSKVLLPHLGKAILMKRPARSKKEAEHNAALLALHHINCGLVNELVIENL